MNQKIYCQKISNSSELKIAIEFLKGGFNWSDNQATIIYKKLCIGIKDVPYGFIFRNKLSNNLIGAILTHYQGLIEHKNKFIKVINLSWWYVVSKERGLPSIYMAKKICSELKDCIITNFSSTKNAIVFFKAIGFKEIDTFTTNFYLHTYI